MLPVANSRLILLFPLSTFTLIQKNITRIQFVYSELKPGTMKKILLLSFALVLIELNSFAQWEFQNPLPTGSSLNSVFFTDANTGYAVGDFGIIIKTLDGGINWTPLSSGTTIPLYSVYFTDVNTGYAVGGKFNGGQINLSTAIILKTTDGGTNWDSVFLSSNVYFSSVFFTNDNTGYAVGYGVTLSFGGIKYGIIFKTTDGGTTWNTQYSGPWNYEYFNSVYFPEVNKGYVVGSGGTILITTDGGTTWSDTDSNKILNSVFFTDDNTGYAVGFDISVGLEEGIILKTIDGGATWTDQYPFGSWLNSVYFANANTGYVVGSGGTILKTSDAGSSWTTQSSGTTNNLSSVYFIDAYNGCAVGDFGTILKTSDGGTTWITQSSTVTTSTLKSVYFSDPNNGHAVGWNDGPPVNTTTAGIPWTASPQYMDGSFSSVFFNDANTGFAAGTHCGDVQCWGVIDKTTDGGITWTNVYIGGLWSSFNSVFFTDINTGYVAGKEDTTGVILKTTDGGTTWDSVYSGTWQSLNSVYFIDPDIGYAVGENNFLLQEKGVILKTTDAGVSWSYSEVGPPLNSVYFISADTGYVVGGNCYELGCYGAIYKTTDGGTNWHQQYTPDDYTPILNSVFFVNATIGYATGDEGTIINTTDGGATWNIQISGTHMALFSVFFTNESTGYIVGAGGTILKTINGGGISTGIIEKQQMSGLKIYPNPATEKITIEQSEPGSNMNGTVSIFGTTGQELIKQQAQGSKAEIEISSLPAGIYFVRLRNSEKVVTRKFIKN